MFAALIGVAGVFVGAVIALMQAWFFERRRERLAARAARRLVAEEMTTLAADATAARQLDRVEVGGGRNIDIRVWRRGAGPFMVEEWPRYRELLASAVTDQVWVELIEIYEAAARLREDLVASAPTIRLTEQNLCDVRRLAVF